ncbi:hypothetical protein D3C84_988660 [compost metagenome]
MTAKGNISYWIFLIYYRYTYWFIRNVSSVIIHTFQRSRWTWIDNEILRRLNRCRCTTDRSSFKMNLMPALALINRPQTCHIT